MIKAIAPRSTSILKALALFVLSQSAAFAETLWVDPAGDDTNNCQTESVACRTINRATSLAQAGDTINVKSGVYIEDTTRSPFIKATYWLDSLPASISFSRSGTKDRPITLQAAPRHEGRVTIDNELKRVGIQVKDFDYIHIKGLRIINSRVAGIAGWGGDQRIFDRSKATVGIVVENNVIEDIVGPIGVNSAGVHLWHSADWVVRNNRIDNCFREGSSGRCEGIQSYRLVNALIQNNTITNVQSGIYWKDHYILDKAGTPVFESEIAYNWIEPTHFGVQVSIRGTGTEEAGGNYIHHNIITGYTKADGAGVRLRMPSTPLSSKNVRVEHNLLNGSGAGVIGVEYQGYESGVIRGNIIYKNAVNIQTGLAGSPNWTQLTGVDYNIYAGSSFSVAADRYSKSQKWFRSLTDWRQASSSSIRTVGPGSAPDKNSIFVAPGGLFKSGDPNFRYASGSKAIGFMPDSSNAGPYQHGNEIIGWSESGVTASAAPLPPVLSIVDN